MPPLTRRAGKRSLSFAEGLISGERRPVSIRVRQKPNGTGRSRRLGREFSVAKRGDFGVLKQISRTKTLRKSRRTTKKTSFRVRFFDGLGLLKSPVVSLETSKRPDAKRRKTRPSTENRRISNVRPLSRPSKRLIPALAAATSAKAEER